MIQAVFEHRQTPLTIPILFEDEAFASLQQLWNNYLKGLRVQDAEKLPLTIAQVLQRLNEWLKIYYSEQEEAPTTGNWKENGAESMEPLDSTESALMTQSQRTPDNIPE